MILERFKCRIGPLHPHLHAYQEGVGTTERITDVLGGINNKPALSASLDFEKAFELANPATILLSLVRKGINGHILAWNKNYLIDRPESNFKAHFQLTKIWRMILHKVESSVLIYLTF